jgi:GNAT superfamily N-acetyltransferase
MIIRLAEKKDIDRIMQIIADARESIGRLGIDQWQYGYPTRDIVKEDVLLERGFVVLDGDKICATFALMLHGEPTYKKIYCGAWLSDAEYLALHRIAIESSYRGKGVAEEIIEFLFTGLTKITYDPKTQEIEDIEYNGTQKSITRGTSFYTALSYGYGSKVVSGAVKGDVNLSGDVITIIVVLSVYIVK